MAAFITPDELSDYLGRDVSDDDGAALCVDFACQVVRTAAEQDFTTVSSDVVVLDGTGTETLLLPQLPVSGTVAVEVSGTAVTDFTVGADGILYAGPDIGISCSSSWPNAGTWPLGRQNVEVTYNHGGSAAPDDVRMVALTLAARMLVQGVAKDETLGDKSITYAAESTALLPTERMVLAKYRRSL